MEKEWMTDRKKRRKKADLKCTGVRIKQKGGWDGKEAKERRRQERKKSAGKNERKKERKKERKTERKKVKKREKDSYNARKLD